MQTFEIKSSSVQLMTKAREVSGIDIVNSDVEKVPGELLAASSDFNFLKFRQPFTPSLRSSNRAEDRSDRVREAEAFVAWFNQHLPQVRLIQEYEAFAPEEETVLFDHTRFHDYR